MIFSQSMHFPHILYLIIMSIFTFGEGQRDKTEKDFSRASILSA